MSEQRKHGLMGTNANVRGDRVDPHEMDAGLAPKSGPEVFGVPTYQSKLEEWAETGVFPWQSHRPAPIVPVTREMLDIMLGRRRYRRALKRRAAEAKWRIHCAWGTLRHGEQGYW
jgi:hypothetical protein